MEALFNAYLQKPELMGNTAKSRMGKDGLHRTVADYIAGMTDRFALLEYEKICGKN
jgi:dGTPase